MPAVATRVASGSILLAIFLSACSGVQDQRPEAVATESPAGGSLNAPVPNASTSVSPDLSQSPTREPTAAPREQQAEPDLAFGGRRVLAILIDGLNPDALRILGRERCPGHLVAHRQGDVDV